MEPKKAFTSAQQRQLDAYTYYLDVGRSVNLGRTLALILTLLLVPRPQPQPQAQPLTPTPTLTLPPNPNPNQDELEKLADWRALPTPRKVCLTLALALAPTLALALILTLALTLTPPGGVAPRAVAEPGAARPRLPGACGRIVQWT